MYSMCFSLLMSEMAQMSLLVLLAHARSQKTSLDRKQNPTMHLSGTCKAVEVKRTAQYTRYNAGRHDERFWMNPSIHVLHAIAAACLQQGLVSTVYPEISTSRPKMAR